MAKADGVLEEVYRPWWNGGGNNKFGYDISEIDTSTYERMYIRLLSEMAMNRFKWIGLPPGTNERMLELALFRQGLCVFYFDSEYDMFFTLRGASAGPLNMYDDPQKFLVYGNSTFNGKTLDATECVPIWANIMRVPDLDIVWTYAKRLAAIDKTIDINTRNARRSRVVVADEAQRLSATNINNQIDKGSAAIFLNTQGLDLASTMTALDLGVHPDTIERLQVVRTKLWNECMGLLGLNFANQDKRERLVVDEVSANDEQVLNMRAVALNERKRACRLINEKYGMSIDVKFHVDIPTPVIATGGEI